MAWIRPSKIEIINPGADLLDDGLSTAVDYCSEKAICCDAGCFGARMEEEIRRHFGENIVCSPIDLRVWGKIGLPDGLEAWSGNEFNFWIQTRPFGVKADIVQKTAKQVWQ